MLCIYCNRTNTSQCATRRTKSRVVARANPTNSRRSCRIASATTARPRRSVRVLRPTMSFYCAGYYSFPYTCMSPPFKRILLYGECTTRLQMSPRDPDIQVNIKVGIDSHARVLEKWEDSCQQSLRFFLVSRSVCRYRSQGRVAFSQSGRELNTHRAAPARSNCSLSFADPPPDRKIFPDR